MTEIVKRWIACVLAQKACRERYLNVATADRQRWWLLSQVAQRADQGQCAWLCARKEAGLPQVRVHDLKHTFGRCLRAAGVSFEDRQDLLGHRSGRITTHYSAAELSRLIEAADGVCDQGQGKPEL